MFSNKDKRNDDGEDIDLSQIINDYEEDHSLRKKIDEMKQKQENTNKAETNNDKKNEPIEKVELDDVPLENTQDLDQTIILNPIRQNTEEELYESEDLGETMVIETEELSNVDEKDVVLSSDDAKQKKINKILIGLGIALGVVILIAIIAFAFSGSSSSSKKDEKPVVEEKKVTNKKTVKKKETKTEKPSIKDNSSKIAQLKGQKASYEEQLVAEQAAGATYTNKLIGLRNLLDTETSNLPAKKAAIGPAKQSEATMKEAYDVAKLASDEEPTNTVKKEAADAAKAKWDAAAAEAKRLQDAYDTSVNQTIPNTEKEISQNKSLNDTSIGIIADLKAKIADIDKELATYE